MQTECSDCGKPLSQHSVWRHKKKSCNGKGTKINTTDRSRNLTQSQDVKENNHQRPNDSQLSSFIDNIINKNPEGGDNNMIESLKSTSMSYAEKNLTTNLTKNKEPVQEILSVHETAKKMNIIPESDESSEDESIVDDPSTKKRKFESADDDISDVSLTMTDASKDDDILSHGSENRINEQEGEYENEDTDTENNDDIVIGRGNEYEEESDKEVDTDIDDDNDNNGVHRLTGLEPYLLKGVHASTRLEDRLYRRVNNMKVYGLDLDADKGLTNVHILEYIDLLKVPKFRGVFMRDELPKRINPVECGIVNLSPHEQLGTHWVCYAKVHNTRIYFDSFGRKTPLEIQMYLKTADEFRNNTPVIQKNTDIVQRVDTNVCGHLCIFVLTSLIREHIPFQKVIDELNYGYSEHYW